MNGKHCSTCTCSGHETAGDETLAQLHRIDVAARVYVDNRTHGNYSKLCDALFDGRPVSSDLPKLEYSEHCGCCQRNKITVEVFGKRSPEEPACDHDYVWREAFRYECDKCGSISRDGATEKAPVCTCDSPAAGPCPAHT